MDQKPPIYLYTDGAASGNPGPGGYGVVLRCGSYEKELSGGFACTTNNRMELLAVILGLEQIRWDNAEVHVWSDSSYVVKALNEGWLEQWKRTGFKKKRTWTCGCASTPSSIGTGWPSTGSRGMPDTPKTSAATAWP